MSSFNSKREEVLSLEPQKKAVLDGRGCAPELEAVRQSFHLVESLYGAAFERVTALEKKMKSWKSPEDCS